MISLILAVAVAPVQLNSTVVRPAPVQPPVTKVVLVTRKQRMAADARALLGRAGATRIVYRPGAASGS